MHLHCPQHGCFVTLAAGGPCAELLQAGDLQPAGHEASRAAARAQPLTSLSLVSAGGDSPMVHLNGIGGTAGQHSVSIDLTGAMAAAAAAVGGGGAGGAPLGSLQLMLQCRVSGGGGGPASTAREGRRLLSDAAQGAGERAMGRLGHVPCCADAALACPRAWP